MTLLIYIYKRVQIYSPYINLMTILLILNKEKYYFIKKPYPISKNKLLVVKKYINKYFNKGFICFSIFLVATPILLAKKLGRGIRFYVNYKGLNTIIIKN